MNKQLTITHLYPDELNLYGDRGNIEALVFRIKKRGVDVVVVSVDTRTGVSTSLLKKTDILFMGGGPDSMQKEIYEDFVLKKGSFVKDYANQNGVGLFICGAYQLLGDYYKPYSGDLIKGISLCSFYTEHFGRDFPRCVGNVVIRLGGLDCGSSFSNFLVGFENHGGNTFLSSKVKALGTVVRGFGNNRKDKTEGMVYNNIVGTYLHGPVLPKNPHLCDFLISTALKNKYRDSGELSSLDDFLEQKAHGQALKL